MTPRQGEVIVKDFDTDQDGTRGSRLAQEFGFTLGGETFELRHGLRVGSTALARWAPTLDRMRAPRDDETMKEWQEANPGEEFKRVDDDEFLEVWTETMHTLLRPGQEIALERVLANEEEPLMLPDLVEVILWAVRTVTGGRPTEASPASSDGSAAQSTEPDDTSSKGASSSPAATAPSTS